jgi:ABC-type phosphate transport system substrate-binding protein
MPSLRLILLGLACLAISVPASASPSSSYVLVRSAENPVSRMSREMVKSIYSGKITSWDSGEPIIIVIGSEDAPAMIWVADKLFGVSAKTLLTKIKQQAFRGEMAHPLTAEDDSATLSRIQSRPGVVGFVTEGAVRSLPAALAVVVIE